MNTSSITCALDFIFESKPSKLTTHYHMKLGAYLSFAYDDVYIWCCVNEAWIESSIDIQDALTFNFEEMTSNGLSCIGKSLCICGGDALINLSRSGVFTAECKSCNFSVELAENDALACIK